MPSRATVTIGSLALIGAVYLSALDQDHNSRTTLAVLEATMGHRMHIRLDTMQFEACGVFRALRIDSSDVPSVRARLGPALHRDVDERCFSRTSPALRRPNFLYLDSVRIVEDPGRHAQAHVYLTVNFAQWFYSERYALHRMGVPGVRSPRDSSPERWIADSITITGEIRRSPG
jgi:hypothetical protein